MRKFINGLLSQWNMFPGIGKRNNSTVMLCTWALGGWMWGGTDRNEPIRAVQAALDSGINAVDTAPIYGFGLSEELAGKN